MSLADPTGGVDLVGEDDQASLLAGHRAGGDLEGGEDVGGSIGSRKGGIAHGTGNHEGLWQRVV